MPDTTALTKGRPAVPPRPSKARKQFTFKMAPAGHQVVERLADRVEKAGFKRPTVSDVGRVIFSVVLNDPGLRDRVYAALTREGNL